MEIKPLKKQSLLLSTVNRSSHGRCSIRKGVLRNFAKFTGKNLCQSQIVSGIGVFVIIVLKFLRRSFYRTPLGDCFCDKPYPTTQSTKDKKTFRKTSTSTTKFATLFVPCLRIFSIIYCSDHRSVFNVKRQPPEVFYKKSGLKNFAICTGK